MKKSAVDTDVVCGFLFVNGYVVALVVSTVTLVVWVNFYASTVCPFTLPL
jgi:hypothetical protein